MKQQVELSEVDHLYVSWGENRTLGVVDACDRERDTVDTRLRKALHIIDNKQSLNQKDELINWIERMP